MKLQKHFRVESDLNVMVLVVFVERLTKGSKQMNGFEVRLGYQGHFSWEMGRGRDSGDNQGGGNIENELKEVVSGQN